MQEIWYESPWRVVQPPRCRSTQAGTTVLGGLGMPSLGEGEIPAFISCWCCAEASHTGIASNQNIFTMLQLCRVNTQIVDVCAVGGDLFCALAPIGVFLCCCWSTWNAMANASGHLWLTSTSPPSSPLSHMVIFISSRHCPRAHLSLHPTAAMLWR